MRPWYPLTWKGRGLPVEPILMVLLTSVGINAELWAGHVSWRCVSIQRCSMLQMQQRGALLLQHMARAESASQLNLDTLLCCEGQTTAPGWLCKLARHFRCHVLQSR